MKRFKEVNADLYEASKDEKLAHDLALITERGEEICAVPIDQLRSKLMKDRHKKMCKGSDHWSQTTKKGPKDFVTNADIKAEKIIIEELKKARPNYSIISEENGVEKNKDDH